MDSCVTLYVATHLYFAADDELPEVDSTLVDRQNTVDDDRVHLPAS